MQATLRDVAEWCGAVGEAAEQAGLTPVRGVSTDTRTLQPGQLFIPLAGERTDGHDHLEDAVRAGAAAALWRRDRPMPDTRLPLLPVDDTLAALQRLAAAWLGRLQARVVGVTGSNGKTTTKDLIASVLATRFRVHKTEGNFNNHIGLPLTILRADPQTEVLVLEMGMSGRGEISLLARLAKPDVAVITNVGEAHLLQLGSRRNIARAKLEIAEGLKPGGRLVYFGDEPLLAEELAAAALPADTSAVTFGEGAGCDLAARDIRVTAEGTTFRVADDPATTYHVPAPGRHNAVNALAAVAVGRLFGLSTPDIARGLASARLTGMRIERCAAHNGALILNDAYNASPTSVRAAIDLVAELAGFRRKWLVLGDMLELGENEAAFHAEIGRYATPDKADALFLYGPLSAHAAEAAKPAFPPGAVRHFDDKTALAEELLRQLEPDDLVLVKASRGMKMEQIVHALQQGTGG